MVSSNFIIAPKGISSQPEIRQKSESRVKTAQLQKNPNFAPCSLNAHKAYAQVRFGSALVSHKSWGAAVQKNGDVNFKMFTWPDAKKVFVQIAQCIHPQDMAHLHEDIIPLRNQTGEITSLATKHSKSEFSELKNMGKGVFEQLVKPDFASHGNDYRFVIVKNDNSIVTVKDPCAMRQPDVLGWSKVYDHNQYQWQDKAWMNKQDKARISRHHFNNKLSNPYKMKIYEMHVPTLTKEGSFEAAKKEIKRIKKDGFNSIHLMPVENTPGYNWGYDGVDKFAPQENFMGGPDKLKELIDYAHKKKINIIMDMVPNHIGPDGNFLGQTGPYTGPSKGFGDTFNYEGDHSENVQEYMANAALNWIENYHVDGIRFDMTKYDFMGSDRALKKITSECHYHYPDVFLIAEDGRNNDPRITRPLRPEEEVFAKEEDHIAYTDRIAKKDVSIDNLGFDSEWDFPFHKRIAAAILGDWDMGQYQRDLYALDGSIRGSRHRVKYPMSHDEEGNNDGTTLMVKSVTRNWEMFFRVDGADDCEKGQNAAHAAHAICKGIATGIADKMNPQQWANYQKAHNINKPLTHDEARQALATALRTNKLSIGLVNLAQGPTMIFQGNEQGNLRYFKFARKMLTPVDAQAFKKEKGYLPGDEALQDSKLHGLKYSSAYKAQMKGQELFTEKLNKLCQKTPALNEGDIVSSIIHDHSEVYALHRKKGNSEVFAVSNFSGYGYNDNYSIHFPEGQWRQVLNSDSKEFGGEGKFENQKIISSSNDPKISLPANSIVFFEKIKPTEVQKP